MKVTPNGPHSAMLSTGQKRANKFNITNQKSESSQQAKSQQRILSPKTGSNKSNLNIKKIK